MYLSTGVCPESLRGNYPGNLGSSSRFPRTGLFGVVVNSGTIRGPWSDLNDRRSLDFVCVCFVVSGNWKRSRVSGLYPVSSSPVLGRGGAEVLSLVSSLFRRRRTCSGPTQGSGSSSRRRPGLSSLRVDRLFRCHSVAPGHREGGREGPLRCPTCLPHVTARSGPGPGMGVNLGPLPTPTPGVP